jgi:hypothetical protein
MPERWVGGAKSYRGLFSRAYWALEDLFLEFSVARTGPKSRTSQRASFYVASRVSHHRK